MRPAMVLICAAFVAGCAGKQDTNAPTLSKIQAADRACMARVKAQLAKSWKSYDVAFDWCRPDTVTVSVADCVSKVSKLRDKGMAEAEAHMTAECDAHRRDMITALMVHETLDSARRARAQDVFNRLSADAQRREQQRQLDYRLRQIEQQQRNAAAERQNEQLQRDWEQRQRAIMDAVR